MSGVGFLGKVCITFMCLRVFLQVFEVYGQTECVGGCTCTLPGDYSSGNVCAFIPVHPPLPNNYCCRGIK